jgi:hypothetical protein
LFRIRPLSSLPTPQQGNSQPPSKSLKFSWRQPNGGDRRMSPSDKIAFAVNEARRQVKFDRMQVERRRMFEAAEQAREDVFQARQEQCSHGFLESEQQRAERFQVDQRQRWMSFQEEQGRMNREYREMEIELTKECANSEEARQKSLSEWCTQSLDQNMLEWEAQLRQDTTWREESFVKTVNELRKLRLVPKFSL